MFGIRMFIMPCFSRQYKSAYNKEKERGNHEESIYHSIIHVAAKPEFDAVRRS